MHPIERHILRELMFHPNRRFSELKPADIDPNMFMYHFRKLLGQELVSKDGDSYALTAEGIRNAGRVRSTSIELRLQPTIATFIACQNERQEWLLHTRAYQPFLGRKTFPYGKLHWGESLHQAAERELSDKTGLEAELQHCGELYLRVWQGEELVVHMLCHLFHGRNPRGEASFDGVKGACCWELVEQPTDPQYMPGFSDLYRIATTSEKADSLEEVELRV